MVTTEVQIPVRPAPVRRRRMPVATGLIPAVVMTALGMWGLNRRGLWGDEAATWSAARRSPAELWHLLGDTDAVHGLYYLLMHGLLLLRADEVTLRLPSVVAMSCAAALVAAIGARLAGPRVGVAAGTLFAVVPMVSLYAQEGRSYALVTACAVAATYCLVRGCESGRRGWWRMYILCTGLAVLLSPFAVLVLAAHAVTLLMARSGAREWRRWSVAAVVTVLLVVPMAWVAHRQGGMGTGWTTAPGWEAVTRLVRSFAGPSAWVSRLVLLLAAAALLVPLRPAAKASMPPAARLTVAKVALPLLVVPPALLIAVSRVQPVYDQRHVLYALPGLALLAASGIDRITRPMPQWVMPLAAALVVSLVFNGQMGAHRYVRSPESRVDDLRAIARLVGREAKPGDAVVFLDGTRRKAAIVYPEDFAGLRDVALAAPPGPSGTLFGTELPPDRLRQALAKAERVWVLDEEDPDQWRVFRDPRERAKQQVLADRFHREAVERLHGGSVQLYVHN